MNGAASPYGQPAAWQEHRTPEGRLYYYNSATKVTQWTKPEELMAPAERALASQPWKEYTAEGGRKYWYNTETKQSSWEMPDAYKNAIDASAPPATSGGLGGPPMGGRGFPGAPYEERHDSRRDYRDRDRDRYRGRDRDIERGRDFYPDQRHANQFNDPKAQAFVPASEEPESYSREEAESIFVKLLRRSGVQPDWTWEQTIRATAKDYTFRAIRDPKERKDAFEKYCRDIVVQDKEKAKERLTKLRGDFETMLKRHPEITHFTRWKTARPMIEAETIFRSTDNEEERRQLFEEYIVNLKKAHAENMTKTRKSAMDGLLDLLPKLNLEPYTRWNDAQNAITSTSTFQSDKFRTLSQLDMLTAFQDHMRALERAFNDSRQEKKTQKYRNERKAREAFKSLLEELRQSGKINAGTKWSQVQPLIEKDEKYVDMAGLGGSTAQELFWDVVEEEERNLRGPRNDVLDVLEDKRFELTATSDFEEFSTLMRDDRRTANIDPETLRLIFDRLREKRAHRRDDDTPPDRHQRRALDDFRSKLKRLDPPLTLNDSYDKARPRLQKLDEFNAIASEDQRRTAFERHLRRLKEKEIEGERNHRRREHLSPDRDLHRSERDRSRGERSHRGAGRGARRSRSPEPDAYEADRRKAIAERERNHRKSTMAENLLSTDGGHTSPPSRRDRERNRERDLRDRDRDRGRDRDLDRDRHRDRERSRDRPPTYGRERERDRERRDRDRDRERDHDWPRREEEGFYDRERKGREEERERLYRRRAERGSYDELPYGDERPSGSSRRRRPDDEDDFIKRNSREAKKPRRDRSREGSAAQDPGQSRESAADVHSGSEEGEIEEEE